MFSSRSKGNSNKICKALPQNFVLRCMSWQIDRLMQLAGNSAGSLIKPPILFRIDKSSLGVSRIGEATPWDDCPYTKSNANTFVRARALRVFLTSCVGINLGDIPRGLRHPRDVPSVDPDTRGQENPISTSTDKSIGITFCVWTIIPWGGH